MKDSLNDFFEYNQVVNERYIKQFIQMDEIDRPERAIKLLAHVLNAHHIWLHRIRQQPARYKVWEDHPTSYFSTLNQRNHQQTLELMGAESLSDKIQYQNSQGEQFVNTIGDILLHIVNHSTYHRAQIAHMLSANDYEVPNSDYIFYKRSSSILREN